MRQKPTSGFTNGVSGITSHSDINLITLLTPKSAISYDTSMWGMSHPDRFIENYRVELYRRIFTVSGFFSSLQPEITRPKNEGATGTESPAFMTTSEKLFNKKFWKGHCRHM